jgi:putative two-component system hydrogenase maturation factor HypX/HoxX
MNNVRKGYIRPVDFKHGRVDMTHGSGGRAMAQLIEELFLAAFDNEWLRAANDQACFAVQGGRMVMATDSHVVSPLFFPGGDIGCLSVHGTINDVAMSGAKPLYLSASFILEEGFPLADLKRIVDSMAQAAHAAGVPVVTGDTKVVEQGKGDGVFITTTGVGVVPEGVNISGDRARPGDAILVSGTLGDHGVAIMAQRESLGFETTIRSDTAALHELVARMVEAVPDIHALRDPTRGGLATTLNEIARQSGVGMMLREEAHAGAAGGRGRLRVPRPRSALRRQRGQADLHLRAGAREPPARSDARASARRGGGDHRLGARRPAPLRADGDRLRRQAHRRLAHRRAAAEDLLMRILFLTHSFNSLAQRLWVELTRRGHEVSIEFDINDNVAIEAVALFRPDLVVAPFLKRAIPEAVWREHVCLVVHPGIPGDRGPSALDWAIMNDEAEWGVTVLQANAVMDGGDIWATRSFPMRAARKSSLYRNEVTEAATAAVLEAVEKFAQDGFKPTPLDYANPAVRGFERPLMKQTIGASTGRATTRRRCCASSAPRTASPASPTASPDVDCWLFNAHPEGTLRGAQPGAIIAQRQGALCRATVDGAVWLTHAKRKSDQPTFKLPAAQACPRRRPACPNRRCRCCHRASRRHGRTSYEEEGGVGFLHFDFYNGAMSTADCLRLRDAFVEAAQRDTKVIVLMGGPDFWSNGIHLNTIEAADSPADESWANINAMDDLCRAILDCGSHYVVAAMQGNAGAGGVFLALTSDRCWRARASSSTRTTRAWATSTARSTGPTCCRAASAGSARMPSRRTACPSARSRRWSRASSTPASAPTCRPSPRRCASRHSNSRRGPTWRN